MIYGFRHEVERWRERGVDDKRELVVVLVFISTQQTYIRHVFSFLRCITAA